MYRRAFDTVEVCGLRAAEPRFEGAEVSPCADLRGQLMQGALEGDAGVLGDVVISAYSVEWQILEPFTESVLNTKGTVHPQSRNRYKYAPRCDVALGNAL